MANHNQNGGRNGAVVEDSPAGWRPEDQGVRGHVAGGDRNHRGWHERSRGYDDDRLPGDRDSRWTAGRSDGHRGSDLHGEDREGWSRPTERYGQGQSGYSAGRQGDDRSQRLQGRNDMVPSAGSFEDRYHELGTDDRFTGRGRGSYWLDRTGYDTDRYSSSNRGRDFDAERRGLGRGGRLDERVSDPAGPHGRSGPDPTRREAEPHVHRGTGPHRGKGPRGYQRSDERIRELVCESLADDDQLDATHIEVSVEHGEVTLSGTVEDRCAKRDAEDCACSVSGVRDVQNLLRIRDERPGRSNHSNHGAVGRDETETSALDPKHRA
jgi:hypothetical protein